MGSEMDLDDVMMVGQMGEAQQLNFQSQSHPKTSLQTARRGVRETTFQRAEIQAPHSCSWLNL
jgi:hypothetical protein